MRYRGIRQASDRCGDCKSLGMANQAARALQFTIQQHVRAARAFHTGLIAETQRHLEILERLEQPLDVLRRPNLFRRETLSAVDESCRLMRRLEEMKHPWRETYRDFRESVQKIRGLLRRRLRRAT
jgi:hypothetical protein